MPKDLDGLVRADDLAEAARLLGTNYAELVQITLMMGDERHPSRVDSMKDRYIREKYSLAPDEFAEQNVDAVLARVARVNGVGALPEEYLHLVRLAAANPFIVIPKSKRDVTPEEQSDRQIVDRILRQIGVSNDEWNDLMMVRKLARDGQRPITAFEINSILPIVDRIYLMLNELVELEITILLSTLLARRKVSEEVSRGKRPFSAWHHRLRDIVARIVTRSPDKADWLIKSTRITQGLEDARRVWLVECLRLCADQFRVDRDRIMVFSDELVTASERSLTAYQLCLASLTLAKHRYVIPRYGRDFADILSVQACGPDFADTSDKISEYFSLMHDRKSLGIRVIRDVLAGCREFGRLPEVDAFVGPSLLDLDSRSKLAVSWAFEDARGEVEYWNDLAHLRAELKKLETRLADL